MTDSETDDCRARRNIESQRRRRGKRRPHLPGSLRLAASESESESSLILAKPRAPPGRGPGPIPLSVAPWPAALAPAIAGQRHGRISLPRHPSPPDPDGPTRALSGLWPPAARRAATVIGPPSPRLPVTGSQPPPAALGPADCQCRCQAVRAISCGRRLSMPDRNSRDQVFSVSRCQTRLPAPGLGPRSDRGAMTRRGGPRSHAGHGGVGAGGHASGRPAAPMAGGGGTRGRAAEAGGRADGAGGGGGGRRHRTRLGQSGRRRQQAREQSGGGRSGRGRAPAGRGPRQGGARATAHPPPAPPRNLQSIGEGDAQAAAGCEIPGMRLKSGRAAAAAAAAAAADESARLGSCGWAVLLAECKCRSPYLMQKPQRAKCEMRGRSVRWTRRGR